MKMIAPLAGLWASRGEMLVYFIELISVCICAIFTW